MLVKLNHFNLTIMAIMDFNLFSLFIYLVTNKLQNQRGNKLLK